MLSFIPHYNCSPRRSFFAPRRSFMDPFSMTDLLEDDPLFYYPRARRNRYRRHPAFFADLEDMTVDGLLGFVWNRDEDDREDEPKTIKQKPAKKKEHHSRPTSPRSPKPVTKSHVASSRRHISRKGDVVHSVMSSYNSDTGLKTDEEIRAIGDVSLKRVRSHKDGSDESSEEEIWSGIEDGAERDSFMSRFDEFFPSSEAPKALEANKGDEEEPPKSED